MSLWSSLKKLPLKLTLISGLGATGLIAIIGVMLFYYHNSMMEDRQQKVREMVNSAYRLIEFYYAKIDKEGLSESDAKRFVFQTIRELPYDANGYCWINDIRGVMLMHPIMPSFEGKNMYDYQDPNGVYLFHDFISTVKNKKEGFVRYAWPKPGTDQKRSYPKLSYVKGFEPWGWVIGSGIYIDDVDTAFKQAVLVSGGLIAAVILFTTVLIITLSESMKKP